MDDSIDIILYENLRERIINNDELSDKEWDLFFYIEEKTKSARIKNNEWNKIFTSYSSNTFLKPEEKQEFEELKEEYILKNVDDIVDYSVGKKSINRRDFKKINEGYSLFNNKQILLALSTGFVILITAVVLFFNKEKIYTGDLAVNNGVSGYSTNYKSNDFILDGKNNSRVNKPDMGLIADASNEKLKETALRNNIDYSTNSYLERYISTDFRSGNNSMKLEQPSPSYESSIIKTDNNLVFKGQISAKPDEVNSLVLKIYNNDEKSYIQDSPVVKKEISIEKFEDGKGAFETTIGSKFKPGLYYYIFEDKDGNMFYVGKLIFRK